MRKESAKMIDLLKSDRTHIYMCGLKGMETGVDEALRDACRSAGLDWEAVRKEMREQGRYHVETY
jgi:benzoyl-CoA 2,3-dioxygenase component A